MSMLRNSTDLNALQLIIFTIIESIDHESLEKKNHLPDY